ncbi:DNA-directed RNA polymerase, putative (mtRNAP) [Plasmodium ovale curtisi]|uniref:DNA-directed RNA polymerase n=2 Tax=Plasmodium ovale curtisi TaxID=864141 RepID=A0A1A8VVG6_PLAOA|nr:DNA-directed RNA polymerase, putative (mtRNAP) [Plasmodium ovale curtisi]
MRTHTISCSLASTFASSLVKLHSNEYTLFLRQEGKKKPTQLYVNKANLFSTASLTKRKEASLNPIYKRDRFLGALKNGARERNERYENNGDGGSIIEGVNEYNTTTYTSYEKRTTKIEEDEKEKRFSQCTWEEGDTNFTLPNPGKNVILPEEKRAELIQTHCAEVYHWKEGNTPYDKGKVHGEVAEELRNLIKSIKMLDENKKKKIMMYIDTLNKKHVQNVEEEIIAFFESLDHYLSANGLLICDIGGREIFSYIEKVNAERGSERDKESKEGKEGKENVNKKNDDDGYEQKCSVHINNLFDMNYIREQKKLIYGDNIYPIVQNVPKRAEEITVKNEKRSDTSCSSGSGDCAVLSPDEEDAVNVRRQMLIERSSYKKAIEEAEEFVSNLHNLKKVTEIQGLCKIYLNWVNELEKKIVQYKEKNKKNTKKKIFPELLEAKLLAIITVKWTIQYTFNPLKKKYSNNVTAQSKNFEQSYAYQSLFTHIAIKIGEEINNELNFQLLEKNNLLYDYIKKNKANVSFSHFQKYKMLNEIKGRMRRDRRMQQDEKGIYERGSFESGSCERGSCERGNCEKGNAAYPFLEKSLDLIQWNSVKKASIGGLLLKMLIENAKIDVDLNTAKEEYKNEYKYYLFLHKTAKNNGEMLHSDCKYKKELNYQQFYEEESNSLNFIIMETKKKKKKNITCSEKKCVQNENMTKSCGEGINERRPKENNFCKNQKEKLKNKDVVLYRSMRDRSKIEIAVFIHSYIWKNNSWYGVIHMRECCANYLLNNAISSHIPLNYLPMICKPKRWTNIDGGGMLLLKNNFIRCNIKPLFNLNVCDMSRIKNIVSEIGNVRWKINKEILYYIEHAYMKGITVGKIPLHKNYTIPSRLDLKIQNNEEIRKYYLLKEEINRLNKCLMSERPTFLQKLAVAKTLKDNEIIYFPHNIDFRGRMYPLSPHLHHMSDDICRSLIVFHDKKEIGKNGLFWLKIHLANNFGKDKLNFEKRIEWVNQNVYNIKKLCENPFQNIEFWNSADKPWQALAVAIDLTNALQCSNVSKYKSNIPVQQDGTCNGLQHYAALGRDKDGGKAVNITPSEEPQDIYSVVLDIVINKIRSDLDGGINLSSTVTVQNSPIGNSPIGRGATTSASDLASYCFQFDLLKRKVVKQTIMTICYGVTSIGAKNQVKGKIQSMIGKDIDKNMINKLSQYISNYIFESISEIFKRAMIIKKWFNNLSKATNELNIPITWISPIGLPCEQPYRLGNRILVNTPLQSVSVTSYKNSSLHKNKQRLGFPPNFVHSLDASHLMMTAEKMIIENNFSFAAVHDSYWAHACNVDIMNKFIRDSFVTLYNEPILENIYQNFQMRLGRFASKIPPPPEQGQLDISLVRQSRYFFS